MCHKRQIEEDQACKVSLSQCTESANAVQDKSASADDSDIPECAMLTSSVANLDTGQGVQSLQLSNPSNEISPKPVVSCEQSSDMHSSQCDSSLSKAHDNGLHGNSEQASAEDSDRCLQVGARTTQEPSCSKDSKTEIEDENMNLKQACPSAAEKNASESSSESGSNNASTNEPSLSSQVGDNTSATSDSARVQQSSISSTNQETSMQGSSSQSMATPVPNSSQASGTSSAPARTSAPKKDGNTSTKTKGKLKRSSGVKGKRSSRPSRTRTLVDDQLLDGEW